MRNKEDLSLVALLWRQKSKKLQDILYFSGCLYKLPQTNNLKQQTFIHLFIQS